MDGPERLEVGRPHRRGPLRPLLALVAGLVALLALRVLGPPDGGGSGSRPDPTSSATTTPSPPASEPGAGVGDRAWPADLHAGRGTLYVAVGGTVLAVDAASGLVTSTGLRATGHDVRLTETPDGLLVWHPDGRRTRLLRFGLDVGTTPGGVFAGANRFLPAGRTGTWAARVGSGTGPTRWRLGDAQGAERATVVVAGQLRGDGAGGLLVEADGTARPAFPRTVAGAETRADPGVVVASGPDGYLVQRGVGGTCTTVLRAGPERTRQVVSPPLPSSAAHDAALSPGNRFVLLSRPKDDEPVVEVRALDAEQPLRTFPGRASGAAWLSDRWLALSGADGLVLYDVVADQVVPSAVGRVVQLAWQPG
ncbi:hypothetical protein [Microlunatus flavus]|uniref:WD40-like Beta Propeller Repeat n=1 Tax=Microlunatus flavus TaxID=1036181 RepID=A0A1H9HGB9_9ACTN|nr:hypothetical protein [Microlunatus flavus]SEQ61357.1 hypothetical protein SAMN05421756_104242 [Microlunatus flavus]